MEAENFGHLNGSHKEAVIMIQNDDFAGITNLLRQIPSLSRWEDYDGRTLLAKAVFSKIILSDKLFLALIASGCDAGVILGSDIPIIQHAIIAGLSSLIILSMIAQPGNTIVFKKVSKSGTLIKAKNNVSENTVEMFILTTWLSTMFISLVFQFCINGLTERNLRKRSMKLPREAKMIVELKLLLRSCWTSMLTLEKMPN